MLVIEDSNEGLDGLMGLRSWEQHQWMMHEVSRIMFHDGNPDSV